MHYIKSLLILMLLGIFVSVDLSAQYRRVPARPSNRCRVSRRISRYKSSCCSAAKNGEGRKIRRVNRLPAFSNTSCRTYSSGRSSYGSYSSSSRITSYKRMPSSSASSYRVKKLSFEGEKNLNTLRRLHKLQLQFIRGRHTLSTDRKKEILYDLDLEKEKLYFYLKDVRKFPYRNTLTSLEDALTDMSRRSNISEEKMLLYIQKRQMRSMKQYYTQ